MFRPEKTCDLRGCWEWCKAYDARGLSDMHSSNRLQRCATVDGKPEPNHNYGQTMQGSDNWYTKPYADAQANGFNVASAGSGSMFAASGSPFATSGSQFALRIAHSPEGKVDTIFRPTDNMHLSLSAYVCRRITILDMCECRIGRQGMWGIAVRRMILSVLYS